MKQLIQLKLTLICTAIILLVAGFTTTAHGQVLPGSNDPSFNTADVTYRAGEGFNGTVYSVIPQPDGKLVMGGEFTSFNGTTTNRVVRLNADGSLDNTFSSGTGFDGFVHAIALQPDGKILVAGGFSSYKGTFSRKIARLNADGSLDESFDIGYGFFNDILSMVLQPDGKVIVGGTFTSINSTARNRIARLNADGSLDTSFNPGQGFNSNVQAMVLQPDGKVVVGGYFSTFNGVSRSRIARLNDDGSLDVTFTVGTGFITSQNSFIRALALQPDGKIVAGGAIAQYNGTNRRMIARINADGSLDNSFNAAIKSGTSVGFNDYVSSITLQSDGKIMVGGEFTAFYGNSSNININRIARLHTNGSLDTSFNPGTGFSHYDDNIYAITILPDSKMIVSGSFWSFNDLPRSRIARLNANGTVDKTFNPATGVSHSVSEMILQPDGKILIEGSFGSYNDVVRNSIARLNADGTLDPSFNLAQGFDNRTSAMILQPDGKIIVGGAFTKFNGIARRNIARLNADGSLDTSFDPGSGFKKDYQDSGVGSLAIQPDGKIVVGGNFTSFNGTARHYIARLNADGSLDASFNPGNGFDGSVYKLALQPDGKIVAVYSSYYLSGSILVRLNEDGSRDNSFYSKKINYTVHSVALQPDGKIIAGGAFTNNYDPIYYRIIRLNANGRQDESFVTGTGFNNDVLTIAQQQDGKIIVGGNFTSFNGTSTNRIARLNDNGTLDTSFDPGTGFDGSVEAVALQPDNKIVVGGGFLSYNGTPRRRIARLYGAEDTPLSTDKAVRKKLDVQVYPNPTSGDINLVFDGSEATTRIVELILYNNIGQPVLQRVITPEQAKAGVKLPTTNFAAGVYHLRVKWNGRTISTQVVLQK
ncbi:T9SS type A sorting domain-containing protein [uncultured Pontibacter sp.]|uniref:T9SS type A sorting domain-containing protein n=1 Tax=uncultured Pontibacter sp. TaxID=453356 RepID=UPI00260A716D|nr:T9SS type A sorting domain-containing protein [uncultured Pontibacter sp.]